MRPSATDTAQETYLLRCWEDNICPCCKKRFSPSDRVGSGRKRDGGFCSLSCYGNYYKDEMVKRHLPRPRKA